MPSTILRGQALHLYTVIGKFCGQLQKRDNVIHEVIFVVENMYIPMLGCPAIEALKFVVRSEPVTVTDTPMTKYTISFTVTTERTTLCRSAESRV